MPNRASAVLTAVLAFVLASPLRADPPVNAYAPQPRVERASIIGFSGSPQVQRAGKAGRETVNGLPVPLSAGDTVHTGKGGRIFLQFLDGSQSTVDQNAVFSVEEEKADSVSLSLTVGKIWCAVSKLANRRFRVRTPTAVASVRGTEFTVESFGDKRTAVEVFGGMVAVRGALGDEAIVGASQRVDARAGRLDAVQRFEARPDPRMPPAKGVEAGPAEPKGPPPPDKRGADNRKEDGRRPQPGFNPERLKDFVAREAGRFEMQNQRESSAAFDQRNELYQAGKSVIDAFGRRVRVEEFITRPAADAFKFVSVSHREDRTDVATVDVRANAALPADLRLAGNLFSAPGTNAPQYWAVQQRTMLRNLSTGDSYVQVGVDGAPRQFNMPGQAFFDPGLNAFVTPSAVFWRTMFGNSYEFQNGNPAAVDRIWSDAAFRPLDNVLTAGTQVAGMTAHFQAVHVNVRNDPGAGVNPNGVLGTYWVDSFVSRDPTDLSGTETGLAFATYRNDPLPGLAWTTKRIDYLDFTDTNGNGLLDFGEALAFDGRFGGQVYHDMVERADGGTLTAIAGAGARQAAGDNGFTGKNAAGNPVASGAILTYGGAGPVDLSPLLIFGLNNPRERLLIDDFVIDSAGRLIAGGSNIGQAGGVLGQNYERRVRGTRLRGDIDVVVSPAFLIQSGAANSGGGGGAVRAPGQPF
ncbi:MAG: FecR family protein [Elusimicrobia bacterium]|nr:FecR family protein [Elusimicrobiota bacterium]